MPSRILLEATKKGIHLFLKDGTLAFKAPPGALTSELRAAITANKNALIDLLRSHEKSLTAAPQIKVREHEEGLGIASAMSSYSQQRLWLLDQIDGGSAHYNMPSALKLTGALDHPALSRAFSSILERHESLRTYFTLGDDAQVRQIIQPAKDMVVAVTDLSQMSADERDAKVFALLKAETTTGFDLSGDLMLRVRLLKLAQDEHILLVTMHHIASDGWSMTILINEFARLYTAYVEGQAYPLAPLAIQYADYAHWQRNWLQGQVLNSQLDYWAKQLASLPVAHSLPLDHARPQLQSFNGAFLETYIDVETSTALNALCQSVGATLFMGLHACFSILLSRYSNETDIVMGSPIANREQAEVAALIGFFANTLVLRSDLSNEPSFLTMLERSKAMLLDAYAHQQVPFEQIVERLQPQRSMSHSSLFQILLVLHNNIQGETLALPNLTLSPVEQTNNIAKYDLSLMVGESERGLELGWEYNTDLFEARTLERMALHFEFLLKGLLREPHKKIADIAMLAEAERHQLLVDWNDTKFDYPQKKCIHEFFEEQVKHSPDAIAVVFKDQQLSYAELNAKANQLAHFLVEKQGVQVDDLIGLCLERSLEMLVGILGTLKASAGYLPLDPSYPSERLHTMLVDAAPRVLLTQAHLLERLHPLESLHSTHTQVVALDGEWQEIAVYSPQNLARLPGQTTQQLAYVIYTSGSTGKPKAAGVQHIGVTNLLHWYAHEIGVDDHTRALVVTSFSFDLTQKNLLSGVLGGGQVHLSLEPFDPVNIIAEIEQHQITLVNLTPSAFYAIIDADNGNSLCSLRHVILGGEPISVARIAHLAKSYPLLKIVNSYGPTECSDVVAYHVLKGDWAADENAVIPLGRPIPNTQLYILDQHRHLVPQGVVGEIYIGGIGVGRGYLNRPELTEASFVPDPFRTDYSGRIYRTGDLGRWLADSTIEYLGRNDHQVKIRGFRIELGEIENALNAHVQVKESIVVARDMGTGDKRLVAYVVAYTADEERQEDPASSASKADLIAQLKRHLGLSLPDYMVPSFFVLMEALPLSPNGKVDRKALPEPEMGSGSAVYVAPRTTAEIMLAAIWAKVLRLERVGIHDNFFELGGHSLLATQVASQVRVQFACHMVLRNLFEAPTIALLCAHLALIANSANDTARLPLLSYSRDRILPLSYAQQRLWFMQQLEGDSATYNMPAALRLRGKLDAKLLHTALQQLVQRHEILRSQFIDIGGEPRLEIATNLSFPLDVFEISEAELATRVQAHANHHFDLAQGPLLIAQLLRLIENEVDNEYVLLINIHHIISDGWSLQILAGEWMQLYHANLHQREHNLADLAIQYADYACWQREYLEGEVIEKQLSYWQENLAGAPELLNLPLDRPRGPVQSFAGASENLSIETALTQGLHQLSLQENASMFMTLLSAFALLMSRYSGESDIMIGTPSANRDQPELEGLIGLFLGNLVLRIDLSEQPSFRTLLGRARATALDAYSNSDVPFERIVDALQLQRDLSRNPLFQVFFNMVNLPEQLPEA
ncbi:MAG: amino acid adenylation domain-containing protein, partial [Undibacterium sp.]|nr:amino acid adenylation domain-containing protein [Undibacterium sp.]